MADAATPPPPSVTLASPPREVTLPPAPAAVIRLTIPKAEIAQVMGPAIGEVFAAVGRADGVNVAGPVFSHHFGIDPETFDFNVGVVLDAPLSAPVGRVKGAEMPGVPPVASLLSGGALDDTAPAAGASGGRCMMAVYKGDYAQLGGAWGAFDAWMREHNVAKGEDCWECYIQGPETGRPPSEWVTTLHWRIA